MKDIKSLYLAAKSSGKQADISAYTEAIQELIDDNPNGYISQLEYIISSDIGLKTVKPFIEKNGFTIACYDQMIETLNECIRKCEVYGKDASIYTEAINEFEKFRKDHIHCFMMFESFRPELKSNYISTYYGKNSAGHQNRKLVAGMISNFGEAAIPDALITADSIGDHAVKTVMEFTANTYGGFYRTIYEWLLTVSDDIKPENRPVELLKEFQEKSLTFIVNSIKDREHQGFRESVILDTNPLIEYSLDDINSIRDLITFKEYQMTWLDELPEHTLFNEAIPNGTNNKDKDWPWNLIHDIIDLSNGRIKPENIDVNGFLSAFESVLTDKEKKVMTYRYRNKLTLKQTAAKLGMKECEHIIWKAVRKLSHPKNKALYYDENARYESYNILQNEIYSLYEMLDGLIDENDNEIFSEASDPKKRSIDKIIYNLKDLKTDLKKSVIRSIKENVKDNHKDYHIFSGKRVPRPAVYVQFGNKKGPFMLDSMNLGKKIKSNMDDIKDSSSEWMNDLFVYITFETHTGSKLSKDQANDYWELYAKALKEAIKPIASDGRIKNPFDRNNYYYVEYVYTWAIQIQISKNGITKGVDMDVFESVQQLSEMLIESINSECFDDIESINESLSIVNTRNKKTGEIPSYLSNNHDINYGEEDPVKKKVTSIDREPTLDDYRRPSAMSDDKPGTQLNIPSAFDTNDDKSSSSTSNTSTSNVSEDDKRIINNYYYTYTNSLNKNNNHNSFNKDNSVRDNHSSVKDDHSRIINSYNKNDYNDSLDSDERPEDKVESSKPWELNPIPKNELFTEEVGDADDNKPKSDHPIKDILTDVDREVTKGQQKAKKAIQDVSNVGRAFMKPINRTSSWINKLVADWKDADETKIKERMADPKTRNNILSAVTWSIKTGSLLKAGLLLNPFFAFLSLTRKIGKNKREFRIRNEMIGELKTEINIIEEKIKDADHKGDNAAKYKLMRLKNELNKKLIRVGGTRAMSKMI